MEHVFGVNDERPPAPTGQQRPGRRVIYPNPAGITQRPPASYRPAASRPSVQVAPRLPAPKPQAKNRFKLSEEEIGLLRRALRKESRELTRYLQKALPQVLGMEQALENVRVTGRDGLEAGDIQADEELLALVTHIRKYEFLAWYLSRTTLTAEQQRRWMEKWLEGSGRTHYRPPTDPSRIGVIVKGTPRDRR